MEAVVNALLAYSDWVFSNIEIMARIFGALTLTGLCFVPFGFFAGYAIEEIADAIFFARCKPSKSDRDEEDA